MTALTRGRPRASLGAGMRLPVFVLAACTLGSAGCLVLPFGVHANRPYPLGEVARVRVGAGLVQHPLGQGAVDAVENDAGTEVNPVPTSAISAKTTSFMLDGAFGILETLDVAYGARGVSLNWAPVKPGRWAFTLSPAWGWSTASASGGARNQKEKGRLDNVNVLGLAAWRNHPDHPDDFFVYGGAGANLLSTKISVTEESPAYQASKTDGGTAPSVVLGLGAEAANTVFSLEFAETFLKERTGRQDAILTTCLLVTWSFNPFKDPL